MCWMSEGPLTMYLLAQITTIRTLHLVKKVNEEESVLSTFTSREMECSDMILVFVECFGHADSLLFVYCERPGLQLTKHRFHYISFSFNDNN